MNIYFSFGVAATFSGEKSLKSFPEDWVSVSVPPKFDGKHFPILTIKNVNATPPVFHIDATSRYVNCKVRLWYLIQLAENLRCRMNDLNSHINIMVKPLLEAIVSIRLLDLVYVKIGLKYLN